VFVRVVLGEKGCSQEEFVRSADCTDVVKLVEVVEGEMLEKVFMRVELACAAAPTTSPFRIVFSTTVRLMSLHKVVATLFRRCEDSFTLSCVDPTTLVSSSSRR